MSWQPALPYTGLLCRYNEIGTKGRNREFFVERLCLMLQRRLESLGRLHFIMERGRIFVLFTDGKKFMTEDDLAVCRKEIPTIAGVSSISPGFYLKSDFEQIDRCISRDFSAVYSAYMDGVPADAEGLRSYAMRVRRVDKNFPMGSEAMERYFAEKLLPGHPGLHFDLKHAGMVIEVEIREKRTFVSYERIYGPGGLPAGSGGHVLALLSGGFDSPVACYQMMRRGCTVDFLTFHSSPYTPPATVSKVCSIVRKLNEYQKRGKMVSVNLLPFQKAVRDCCSSRYRTVLYRRFMLRIANILAVQFGSRAIITGDNIGQVASQTLENMSTINAASKLMVLRPLLTYDKLETMRIASEIGTFELSKPQVPDSCTVFQPSNPATSTELADIAAEEAKLDMDNLTEACLKLAAVVNAKNEVQHPFTELLDIFRNQKKEVI